MAESIATPQEIAQTVTTMHDAIVAAWLREEVQYSPLTEGRTTTQWGIEVMPDCNLSMVETRLNEYRSLEAPMDNYKEKNQTLSLNARLSNNRRGSFNLRAFDGEVSIRNNYRPDEGVLSEAWLLNLLGVAEPHEVFDYVQEAVASRKATKISVNRILVTALPLDNRWPMLHTQDTVTKEGTTIQTDFTQLFETAEGIRHLNFEAIIAKNDGTAELLFHEYSDTREIPEVTKLSPQHLAQLGKLTLQTLDLVYGHGSFWRDIRRGAIRDEVLGLNDQPNEHARSGYDFARQTGPR